MAKIEVIKFLKAMVQDSNLKNQLKVKQKEDVLKEACQIYSFTEKEFDDVVWDLEGLLAQKRGENFDLNFSLWETMWGKYYLEFVVDNVVSCLSDQELEQVTK
ncbi:MAG: Nif11-like leader peptide family natural product precursor [Crocosphaera sp.]